MVNNKLKKLCELLGLPVLLKAMLRAMPRSI